MGVAKAGKCTTDDWCAVRAGIAPFFRIDVPLAACSRFVVLLPLLLPPAATPPMEEEAAAAAGRMMADLDRSAEPLLPWMRWGKPPRKIVLSLTK